ncbi:hypothetical protein K501DRAFT_197363 [Backusella circina FSU 941]|nr:hypothetical protein K501DRAFT_197363 [Backusella circina FSU 941]
MVAKLITEDDSNSPLLCNEEYLSGPTVSSLHKLRDIDNSDAGFFVFSGLGVKKQGTYRLHFSFFELIDEEIYNRKTVVSECFTVYPPRQFPGPLDSTFLSRMFSDQGVRLRTRKEHRYQT